MNYSTREKIEKFAKDELDLGPFDEKTLRLIDFVDDVIQKEVDADEEYDRGYEAGKDDGNYEGYQEGKSETKDDIVDHLTDEFEAGNLSEAVYDDVCRIVRNA